MIDQKIEVTLAKRKNANARFDAMRSQFEMIADLNTPNTSVLVPSSPQLMAINVDMALKNIDDQDY